MTRLNILFTILIVGLLLCSCQQKNRQEPTFSTTIPTVVAEPSITLDGVEFTVEQINAQLIETLNTDLYYTGTLSDSQNVFHNSDLILNRTIEYDLYFRPTGEFESYPKIFIAITNLDHPLSTDTTPMRYEFGIDLTPLGLRSTFSYSGHTAQSSDYNFLREDTVFLGSYSMCITEITQPVHEDMSTEWKEKTKAELCLYIEESADSVFEGKPLPNGKYYVYVQGFSESDQDACVFFEHEDGKVYWGRYLFVHNNDGTKAADLHKVEFDEYYADDSFQLMLERIRKNPALSFEYTKSGL